MHGRHHGRGHRSRHQIGPDEWAVRARIERFHEPALLLLLRERPRHGYELIELLPEVAGGERVDVGNLYRFLRRLESEGIVESEWNGELPGPAKRTYSLTPAGERCSASGPTHCGARVRTSPRSSTATRKEVSDAQAPPSQDAATASAAGASRTPRIWSSGWRSTSVTSSRRSPTSPI